MVDEALCDVIHYHESFFFASLSSAIIYHNWLRCWVGLNFSLVIYYHEWSTKDNRIMAESQPSVMNSY